MRFEQTPLAGAWVIEAERSSDDRGWFARTYDRDAFAAHGIDPTVVQCNASFNERAGTLRGLHAQADPHGEPKLVRCTRGAIFDVIVDLRTGSDTRGLWFGVELSPRDGRALHVPVGFAHGFQTLEHESEVQYMMGAEYVPEAAFGVRWDDPAFAIEWPAPPPGGRIIAERDLALPDWRP